jgi:hypothetical protein
MGVSFFRGAGKLAKPWAAYINVNGRRKNLGYFATEEAAAAAYNTAAQELHGAFACLNRIEAES